MTQSDYLRHTYGFIGETKMITGNWSAKISVFPQPDWYADAMQPLRYGGQVEPSDDNADGYGVWIPLGDDPETITHTYGAEKLVGRFVEIRYTGEKPQNGRAYIIKQPSSEDNTIKDADERGLMRILSAIEGLL
jgi:hypothetical protein